MTDITPMLEPATPKSSGQFGTFALVAFPAVSLLLLIARPVWDVDIFWQLKLGELILENGGPVLNEPFAASHAGEPLPSLAWAAQALYAGLRLLGGWSLLRTIDALCWLGGFWFAGWSAYRRGASASGVALGLILALVVTLPSASLRPQSLAVLCFGGLIALVFSSLRTAWKLVLGAALLVAWQNLHPSVTVAAVWLGVMAGTDWVQLLHCRARRFPWVLTALCVFAALAIFATPEGTRIIAISAVNAKLSSHIGVSEWLPLWHPANYKLGLAVGFVALWMFAMVFRSRRFAANELLSMLVLLVLSSVIARFVLFWAVALVPIIALALPRGVEPSPPRWLIAPTLIAALLAIILPIRFSPQLPLQEVAALRATGIVGTVYAHFPWGGALIDAGYPVWRVAYDGRYYRYTAAEWNAYFAASNGDMQLSEIEARWRPSAFLLDPVWNAPLITALRADRRWRELPKTRNNAPVVTYSSGWRNLVSTGPSVAFVLTRPKTGGERRYHSKRAAPSAH